MDTDKEKRSEEVAKREDLGSMSSFNNRAGDKEAQLEDVTPEHKDEKESYMDYNGNSEQNAPARS